MQTTVAPDCASSQTHDAIITTDIDVTVDLDGAPQLLAVEDEGITAQPSRIDDVPFHDEVPQAARKERFPIAPGRVLSDRFVLTKLIGSGGTCSVFLARDLEADRHGDKPKFVALKTPRPDCKDPTRAIERLQREFEHARQLNHAGIVQVFELGCDADTWFMTMELLEGESLASLMRREAGALPPYLARRVLRGAADALSYAHAAGIAHGDVNPANIFVLSSEQVKLLDFGAACHADQRAARAATLAYASPQVLEGEAPQPRDDVFAFGCIAYQILTGKHPFQQRASTLARAEGVRPQTPSELTNEQTLALMGALAWDRDARPEDVRKLASTLAPDAPRRRVGIAPAPIHTAPPGEGMKLWWLLGAVGLLAMIAAVVSTRSL